MPEHSAPNPKALMGWAAILVGGVVLIPVTPQIGVALTFMNSAMTFGISAWAYARTRNHGWFKMLMLSTPFALLTSFVFTYMLIAPDEVWSAFQSIQDRALVR